LEETVFKIQKTPVILLVLVSIATPAFGQRCGVERWSVKTGTDSDAQRVDLANPRNTTIGELIALTPPHPIPVASRFTPTETTVFVVNATLTDYKLEGGPTGDSDYHLVLEDEQGRTMVAEIPSPHCVGNSSPFAAQVASSRARFDGKLTAGLSFQTADIPVQVTGVGFFDFSHGQHGAAPNIIELHPILDIVFNPQMAGGTDFSLSVPSLPVHIAQGGSASVTVSTSSIHGPLPNVVLSTSGLPTGVNSDITPAGNGIFTLTLTVSARTSTGSSPFTITGTGGGKSHSQIATLDITSSCPTPIGQDWEYQVIGANSEQEVIDQANKLGTQGWELVSVVRVAGTPGWKAFFKRLKQSS
jgi:hypothetical protein